MQPCSSATPCATRGSQSRPSGQSATPESTRRGAGIFPGRLVGRARPLAPCELGRGHGIGPGSPPEKTTPPQADGLGHPTAPTPTQQSIAKRPVPAHTSTTMDAASESAGGSGLVGIWVWLCGGCRQARANLRTSVSLSGVPGGCSRGAPHHPLDQTKLQLSLSELDLSRLALRFNSPRRTRRRTALLPSSRRRCRRRS
jgi:hypothetical protein